MTISGEEGLFCFEIIWTNARVLPFPLLLRLYSQKTFKTRAQRTAAHGPYSLCWRAAWPDLTQHGGLSSVSHSVGKPLGVAAGPTSRGADA